MLRSLTLVLLIAYGTAKLKPFNSIKARRETIDNYEVVIPRVVSKIPINAAIPQHMVINISSTSGFWTLSFSLNQNFLADNFESDFFDDDHYLNLDQHHYLSYHYSGKVDGHPDWFAFMSIYQGIRAEFGDIKNKELRYHLEPISTDMRLEQPHAFYNESEYEESEGHLGCEVVDDIIFPPSESSSHGRVRRQIDETLYVEWVAVNDAAQYAAYDSNLTTTVLRTLDIANGVNNIYSSELNIRVVLTRVITFTNGSEFPESSNASMLLSSFANYASSPSGLLDIQRDNIMLFTGIEIDGSTVGLAYVGTVCINPPLSASFTQDGGKPLATVVSIAAHEMGHNFNMRHDDGRNCSCPDSACIMEATLSLPPPTRFSSCSRADLAIIADRLDCLLNVPTMTVGGQQCGNGLVEGNETCDCGEPAFCTNPCCNATTCQLAGGAQCATGTCCNGTTCQFVGSDSICRASIGECDIAETCTGSSGECPFDAFMMNGISCASDTGYCFNGQCPTHNAQCMAAWSSSDNDLCTSIFNTAGSSFGNCGQTSTNYIACSSSNVQCGLLQCNNGTYQGIYSSPITLQTGQISTGGDTIICRSAGRALGPNVTNPGLVQDGSRCGSDMMCISQECRDIASLNFPSCPLGSNGQVCSGNNNGICNHLGQCSCVSGFGGNTCEQVITPTTTNIPQPTTTNIPQPTTTNVPQPTTTSVPQPTTTDVPQPTTTNVPQPTTTDVPQPTTTDVPQPTTTTTNVPQPTTSDVPQPTTTTDVPQPTTTDVPQPTTTDVPQPTTTDVPQPTTTTTDVPQPTTTDVPQPTTTDVLQPTTSDVPQPTTTTDVPQPTTTDIPQPTTSDVPQPTTTDVPQPTTTDVPQPTTTDVPQPTTTITDVPQPTTTDVPQPTTTNPIPSPTMVPPESCDLSF